MKINILRAIFLSLTMLVSLSVNATKVDIYARANSSTPSGGGVNTGLSFEAGEYFAGSVNPNDLWAAGNHSSAGSDTRWSNADGLTKNLFATGSDDSGKATGTLIGKDYGTWTQDNHTAAYGALVGKIGDQYYTLGTDFKIEVKAAGALLLFFWDKNSFDNQGKITVDIGRVMAAKDVPDEALTEISEEALAKVLNEVLGETPEQAYTVSAVPLPPSALLLISGFLGLLGFKKRNNV